MSFAMAGVASWFRSYLKHQWSSTGTNEIAQLACFYADEVLPHLADNLGLLSGGVLIWDVMHATLSTL